MGGVEFVDRIWGSIWFSVFYFLVAVVVTNSGLCFFFLDRKTIFWGLFEF